MRQTLVAGVVVALSGLSVARPSMQLVQPVPGPGSGIVTVQGQVDVGRLPPIDVGQRGVWSVRLADEAAVRVTSAAPVEVAAPAFLEGGRSYLITWPDGSTERLRAQRIGAGGWVLGEGGPRPHWVNLATARAIDVLP